MHLFTHFQKSYVCLHVVLNIMKMRSFCMFSSKGLSRQHLLSFSNHCCIMVYFGWDLWETACSRFVGECWQRCPLQDSERSRIQEQCLSWSLGSLITEGSLLFQIAIRRPDFYSLQCPVNKYGLLLGEGMALGDATFSSQQLGWALPAITLLAAGMSLCSERVSGQCHPLVITGSGSFRVLGWPTPCTPRFPHSPPFNSVPWPPREVAVWSF